MQNDLVKALETELQREQRILVRGDLDALADLVVAKQGILDALDLTETVGAEKVAGAQHLARRNMAMIEAALRGVRSAGQRLDEIRRVSRNLDTYSSKGAKQNLGDTSGTMERRA